MNNLIINHIRGILLMPNGNHDALIKACQAELAKISLCEDPNFMVNQAWRSFLVAYLKSKALTLSASDTENTEAMRLHLRDIITFCKDRTERDFKTIYEIINQFCQDIGIDVGIDAVLGSAPIRMR